MAGYQFIWSTCIFIETRVRQEIRYSELELVTGYSYRHIRETFKEVTGMTLSRYILERRIAGAAFEIIHNPEKKLTDIGVEFMFNSHDSFTRAFKRVLHVTPATFRNSHFSVGRKRLLMGLYAPYVYIGEPSSVFEPAITEVAMNSNEVNQNMDNDSCILYQVPKVAYTYEECTPFPTALKACLNYLGQEVDYTYIMAVTGAAFRLRWNKNFWDGGNVDVMTIYEDPYEVFEKGFKGIGREYRLIKRENSTKEDFIDFIKKEIDDGRPVISFGIIGPPEAGLITGYRENGEILLGWNCFQENTEFAKGVKIDESGYYICSNWWENTGTKALIAVGEKQGVLSSPRDILKNAIEILEKEEINIKNEDGNVLGTYLGGRKAYEKWANDILNDPLLKEDAVFTILIERLMCQGDAEVMIGEGRHYASNFMKILSKQLESEGKNEAATLSEKASDVFLAIGQIPQKMIQLRGGFEQNESVLKNFAKEEVRQETEKFIHKANELEIEALAYCKNVLSHMQ